MEALEHHATASVAATEDSTADEVLTVSEAARVLRVGRNQMYEALARGEVPHLRIGRSIRLSRNALVRCLGRSCGAASRKD